MGEWLTRYDVDIAVLVPIDGELRSIAGLGKLWLHILHTQQSHTHTVTVITGSTQCTCEDLIFVV